MCPYQDCPASAANGEAQPALSGGRSRGAFQGHAGEDCARCLAQQAVKTAG